MKYLDQSKEIEQNGRRPENFGISVGEFLTAVKEVLFLEGVLGTRLCLQPDLRFL